MPRKRESTNVILLKGNKAHLTRAQIAARQEAEAALYIGSNKVACPAWLDAVARREWRRIVPDLKRLDLLSNVDVTSLAVYCDAVSHYIRASMASRPRETKSDTDPEQAEMVVCADAGKDAQKWAGIIRSFLAEFGLSPSARLKLRPPEKKEAPQTPFQKKFGHL